MTWALHFGAAWGGVTSFRRCRPDSGPPPTCISGPVSCRLPKSTGAKPSESMNAATSPFASLSSPARKATSRPSACRGSCAVMRPNRGMNALTSRAPGTSAALRSLPVCSPRSAAIIGERSSTGWWRRSRSCPCSPGRRRRRRRRRSSSRRARRCPLRQRRPRCPQTHGRRAARRAARRCRTAPIAEHDLMAGRDGVCGDRLGDGASANQANREVERSRHQSEDSRCVCNDI